jgi:signal transduction histidine kinase
MLDWDSSTAADLLRARTGDIVASWERDIRADAPELSRLDARELCEPVNELVDKLADSLDQRSDRAATLWTIVDAHVLHRLRHGLALGIVVLEYARLRVCIHAALAEMAPLTSLDQALDRTVAHAAERYHDERDLLRDRFVGMLAHDLRNPLSCIAMGTELLFAGHHASRERRLLDQIAEAAERMQRMVADVLGFARARLGDGIPIAPRDADLGEIVRRVVDEMQTIHGADAVVTELAGDLRGAFDCDRVHQLVTNLVRNAIEHGVGPAFVHAREATNEHALILVVYNRQASNTAPARPTNVHGLGLYIVDQIARAHGARVELSSEGDEMTVTVRWVRPQRLDHGEAPLVLQEGA